MPMTSIPFCKYFACPTLLVAGLACMSSALVAKFDVNFTMTNNTLSGLPFVFAHTGYGQFSWTYSAGDFANGTGQLLSIQFPTISTGSGTTFTADLTGLTGTDGASIQNQTYDFAINFAAGLTSPTSQVAVTGGNYDFTGIYYYAPGAGTGGEFLGSVTGGVVTPSVPEPVPLFALLGLTGLFLGRRSRAK